MQYRRQKGFWTSAKNCKSAFLQAEGLLDEEGEALEVQRAPEGIANEQEGNFNSAVEDGVAQEKVCSTLRFFSTLACSLLVLWQYYQIS